MDRFNPTNWFWFVGDNTKVYASARNIYVTKDDPAYVAWSESNLTMTMPDEAELWYYMKAVLPPWVFDGTTFVQPGEGAYTQTQLKSYSGVVEDVAANSGMVAAGIPIGTDPITKRKIADARTAAEADPEYTTTVVGSDGNLYPADAAKLIEMSDAVIAFGTVLNDTYATLHTDIDAGTVTTLQEIDAAFAGVARDIKHGRRNHYRGG
ncbi:DUF4376 domain-containing protein [Bradyrhizobium cytisi]|uniref:DUF4376 domain-containing protein n=1 Tax=Bradyrhizobium cytisi TaxID=515489 RepID=A0A5S4X3B1_9BRAD|nr:DUF4376 domain-containing protein [Bradyrhizobium cytisi]TYL87453.1 DUF4376 domain-containing protein [Bradyrhizobium cytisi]